MRDTGKVIIVLLMLLAAASIAISGVIYLNLEKVKSQNAAHLKKISALENEKADLEKEAEAYKTDLAQVNTKLGQSEKKIKELALSLDDERAKNQDALVLLNKELEKAKSVKSDLEKKIAAGADEINSLKSQIEKLKKDNGELNEKLKESSAKSDVQLGKIVIASDVAASSQSAGGQAPPEKVAVAEVPQAVESPAAAKPLEGKVLVVNKEYAFVVVNLGARDGLSAGDTLSVYQNEKNIGDIVVERADTAMSSANFTDPKLKDIVKENDTVTIKGR